MTVSSAVVAQQNRCVRKFREAEATSREAAKTLEEIGVRDSRLFTRMAGRGVFVDAGAGKYYLDDEAWEMFRQRRRRLMLTLTLVAAAILVSLQLWYWSKR